jgi:hypothetical protein
MLGWEDERYEFNARRGKWSGLDMTAILDGSDFETDYEVEPQGVHLQQRSSVTW